MALSDSFKAFVAEQLAPLGPIEIKRMFGGASAYLDGKIFALLDDDALYFKVDEATKAKFEAEGMGPLTYPSKNGPMTMDRYRRCPDRLFDEAEELLDWARAAVRVAQIGGPKVKRPKSAGKPAARTQPARPVKPKSGSSKL